MGNRRKLLIEDWLPFEALGAESQRERGASSALPPLYFLHVWWARRPLTASRAAVLASTLPAWSDDWPGSLREQFPDEDAYHAWFLHLIGIHGDPVAARRELEHARNSGKKISNPYGYNRAFTYIPNEEEIKTLGQLHKFAWGEEQLSILDPFAGGGSIPFEALRFGYKTIANELNPVAAVILKATLEYPARFGVDLAEDLKTWSARWYKLVQTILKPYFTPLPKNAEGAAYLWARTVACPETGKPVPLSPNWWLRKGDKAAAVRLIAEPGMDAPMFEILEREALDGYDPDEGTVNRGVGRSPWTGQTIPGDYIKQEAQAGRMGQMLYAIALKKPGGFEFRAPTQEDLEAVVRAEEELARVRPRWEAEGIIPTEPFPGGNDPRPLHYGMPTWADMFSPRQLFSLGTFVETLRELRGNIHKVIDVDRADALETLFALAIDKAVDYNAKQTFWDPIRGIRHVFSRHDFAFRWVYCEFDSSKNLLPWTVEQVRNAYSDLARLSVPAQSSLLAKGTIQIIDRLSVHNGNAADLASIDEGQVHNITVDPPYYDNVMYAELSDFFYVWLKRTTGHLFPEFFRMQLTDKDEEAVANPARFAELGSKKKKELAKHDYERKMAAAFREAYRVLRDDGSLTVMFTHKRIEAWDTLASALLEAGFSINASWPVHTESGHSLHQAKKNAAASTILLACRKREVASGSETVWWEDLQADVRRTAREKAKEFAQQGVRGVDLYISVFGPTLSVISARWPVYTSDIDPDTGEPRLLRPEVALDLAREEVLGLRRELLLSGQAVSFDELTDWYLMAWDSFAAEQFPYDEARKLSIGVGVELDKLVIQSQRLAERKGKFIRLLAPWERRARGRVNGELESFDVWINAAHTAMMLYKEDGPRACEVFLRNAGLREDGTFKALLGALLKAIPRRKAKGKFLRSEAEVLENMRLAFFEDIPAPLEDDEPDPGPQQIGLPGAFDR